MKTAKINDEIEIVEHIPILIDKSQIMKEPIYRLAKQNF